MKLLTLNTHSYMEDNFETKFNSFIDCLVKEDFDIIALQEVNQLEANPKIIHIPDTYVQTNTGVVIKEDNYALKVVNALKDNGKDYYWTYLDAHIGYHIYDEGVALLSKYPIEDVNTVMLSKIDNFEFYKNRRALGIKVKNCWYYSIHLGWWDDTDDPLNNQVDTLINNIDMNCNTYLMGDFNSPAHIVNEGYSYILNTYSFCDTYKLAQCKHGDDTVVKKIDGWKHSTESKMRIDLILKNNTLPVLCYKTIFDGNNYDIVSDHFGVTITDNN